jgi:hypothetical protein
VKPIESCGIGAGAALRPLWLRSVPAGPARSRAAAAGPRQSQQDTISYADTCRSIFSAATKFVTQTERHSAADIEACRKVVLRGGFLAWRPERLRKGHLHRLPASSKLDRDTTGMAITTVVWLMSDRFVSCP